MQRKTANLRLKKQVVQKEKGFLVQRAEPPASNIPAPVKHTHQRKKKRRCCAAEIVREKMLVEAI